MNIKLLLSLCLILASFSSPAAIDTLYPEAEPCDPSPFGTHCTIDPKTMPNRAYKYPTYCGNTLVFLTHRQKKVLDAYLRENRNMVLKYKVDGEFIDAPCF
jgi:hypothetical protein